MGAGPLRSTFAAGVRDMAPILIGVIPFGIIAGVAAVEAGLTTVQAIATSQIVFAGGSQLAMMDLIGRDAAPLVIVATALVINSRSAMYSAALAAQLRGLRPPRTLLAAYLLTDESFAVSNHRFARETWDRSTRLAYYLGTGVALWTTWQIATVAGVVVGGGVPPEWSLDFAIPLVFLALAFPAAHDRGTRVAAVTAAVVAMVAAGLPLNLGLLTAVVAAIAAGLIAERGR